MIGLATFQRIWSKAGPAWFLLVVCGCASTVRLPAIDPTGQQLFLPQPAYTTLESPLSGLHPHGYGLGGWPRPAFTQPPPIPFCPPTPTAVAVIPAMTVPAAQSPLVTATPEAFQDRLLLTPARMVAPVNTEVILLAGICGPDGYYVTRQPIEWSLSQESVGQFVDVGERRHARGFYFAQYGPHKLTNDFALTKTSTKARAITRGTPSLSDDVWLQKGQAWLSVTSASQGVSHITAVATGAENWDQRRQLARIHWVDAEWVLPPPAIVKAGSTHVLSTKVSRSSNGQPLSGWTVRYQLAAGAPATLGPSETSSVDVTTDTNGRANVTLSQRIAASGSSQVSIHILSPADRDQPIEVGQGQTTVTWSAPGLDVRISGPDLGTPESTLSYRIVATNPGDLAAQNVSVTASVPPLLRFLNADPPEEAYGDELTWNLGSLAPGATETIVVNCRALREGSVRFRVTGRADGIAPVRVDSATTEILGQDLKVEFVDPPRSGVVGETHSFRVAITNLGTRALSDVEVLDTFDPGLEHVGGGSSPIRRSVGTIEVGDTSQIAVTFVLRQPGTLCHTLEATSAAGHSAKARACIEVIEPQLRLRVRKTGPTRANVGDEVTFAIEVSNAGDAPLTDVRIVDDYPAVLAPQFASDGHEHTDAGLEWRIPRLDPGATTTREVVYRCLAAQFTENRVTVTSREGGSDMASAQLTISDLPSQPNSVRRPTSSPDPGVVAGEGLELAVSQSRKSITVGESITYTLDLRNNGDTSEKSVVLSFILPSGLEFIRFNSVSAELALRPPVEGRYQVERIAEMRQAGKRLFKIDARARALGSHDLQVEVISLNNSDPIEHSISTHVIE